RGATWSIPVRHSPARRGRDRVPRRVRRRRPQRRRRWWARRAAREAPARGKPQMRFTVGLKRQGKAEHIVLDAEDALTAALRVKAETAEATIMYGRPANRRGDARPPPHNLSGKR